MEPSTFSESRHRSYSGIAWVLLDARPDAWVMVFHAFPGFLRDKVLRCVRSCFIVYSAVFRRELQSRGLGVKHVAARTAQTQSKTGQSLSSAPEELEFRTESL